MREAAERKKKEIDQKKLEEEMRQEERLRKQLDERLKAAKAMVSWSTELAHQDWFKNVSNDVFNNFTALSYQNTERSASPPIPSLQGQVGSNSPPIPTLQRKGEVRM